MRIRAIVIGGIAVLFAGLGGAAVYLRAGPAKVERTTSDPTAPPAARATVPVEMSTLLVPIVRNGRLEGHLALSLTLEAAGEEAARRARMHMPSLRDAFLREVSDVPVSIAARTDAVDLEELRGRLAARATAVLGPDTVAGILIPGAMPLRP